MQTVILADIFGYTPHLQVLAERLPGQPVILDPYDGKQLNFCNETEAYRYFTEVSGVQVYTAQLRSWLQAQTGPVAVVAFSAGAAALWQVLATGQAEQIERAVGFYGNQIRHAVQLQPSVPVTLVMPVSEVHFSVAQLSAQLQEKSSVTLRQTAFQHGFMNPCSGGYSAEGYQEYVLWLEEFLA